MVTVEGFLNFANNCRYAFAFTAEGVIFFVFIHIMANYKSEAKRYQRSLLGFLKTGASTIRFNLVYIAVHQFAVCFATGMNEYLFTDLKQNLLTGYSFIVVATGHFSGLSAVFVYLFIHRISIDLADRLWINRTFFSFVWCIDYIKLHFDTVYNYMNCKRVKANCEDYSSFMTSTLYLSNFWLTIIYMIATSDSGYRFLRSRARFLLRLLNREMTRKNKSQQAESPETIKDLAA